MIRLEPTSNLSKCPCKRPDTGAITAAISSSDHRLSRTGKVRPPFPASGHDGDLPPLHPPAFTMESALPATVAEGQRNARRSALDAWKDPRGHFEETSGGNPPEGNAAPCTRNTQSGGDVHASPARNSRPICAATPISPWMKRWCVPGFSAASSAETFAPVSGVPPVQNDGLARRLPPYTPRLGLPYTGRRAAVIRMGFDRTRVEISRAGIYALLCARWRHEHQQHRRPAKGTPDTSPYTCRFSRCVDPDLHVPDFTGDTTLSEARLKDRLIIFLPTDRLVDSLRSDAGRRRHDLICFCRPRRRCAVSNLICRCRMELRELMTGG